MEENSKPSYEQLEQMTMEISQKNRELMNRNLMLQTQLNNINTAALTVKYLFKVLANKECFPVEYVEGCAREIMDMLNINKQEEPKEE